MKIGMSNLAGSAAWLFRRSRPSEPRIRWNTIATDVWSSTARSLVVPVIIPCLVRIVSDFPKKAVVQANTLKPKP